MKKILSLLFTMIVTIVAIGATPVHSVGDRLYINAIRVNGYLLNYNKGDIYAGAKVDYDVKKIKIDIDPEDPQVTVIGEGFVDFIGNKQIYDITLSKGDKREEYHLVVARKEIPATGEILKKKIINIIKSVQLPLMVIPGVILIIIIFPEKVKKKKDQ